jgi:hypothetical protein
MVLQTAHMFNNQMIPNAGNNIIIHKPSMGPIAIDDVSSVDKLEFLLVKS